MTPVSTTPMNEAQAIKWVAEVLGEPADTLSPDVARDALASWDSLGMLMLISALDESFGILVPDAVVQRMATVGDILGVLRQHEKLA